MTNLTPLDGILHKRRLPTPGVIALPLSVLQELKGFWVTAHDNVYKCFDLSYLNLHLTANGAPRVHTPAAWPGVLAAYWVLDGTNDYFDRVDEALLSPTGSLTICGWVKWDDFDVEMGIVEKWETTAGNNRCYAMWSDTNAKLNFAISSDGGSVNSATATTTDALSADTWYFVQGRFDSGTSVAVRVDDNSWDTSATALAAIDDNARSFYIGMHDETAAKRLDGRWSWLAKAHWPVSDTCLNYIYNEQAPLFGRT